MTTTSAGWHPDPGNPSQVRYWDGRQWMGEPRPATGSAAGPGQGSPAPQVPRRTGSVAASRPVLLWTDAEKLQGTGRTIAVVGGVIFGVSVVATVMLVLSALGDSGSSNEFGVESSSDDFAIVGALMLGAPGIVGGILLTGVGQLMRVVAHYVRWRVAETYDAETMSI